MYSDKSTNQFWLKKKLRYRFFCWICNINVLSTSWMVDFFLDSCLIRKYTKYSLNLTFGFKTLEIYFSDVLLRGVQKFVMIKCRPTDFRNFKISNIKIAKNELFDFFIYEFIYYYYYFKITWHSMIFPNFINFINC